MADDSIGPDPGTEDEFDRQLRALTDGSAGRARFHELSAAERAKAGARRAKQARKQAARDARRAEQTARLAAEGQPTASRRLLLGSLIIVVAVAMVSGVAWLSLGRPLTGKNDVPPQSGTAPAAGTQGASTASETAAVGGPPSDPFGGTPEDSWADGAAGIVIPTTSAVGGYTSAQVYTAYQDTRRLLIAAALDRQTLLGGQPTAFAGLLTGQQRTPFLAGLNRVGEDKHGIELSTRILVASFAPGGTRFIGSVIKVHGTMGARAAIDRGQEVLAVEVNYQFVYPVEPPGAPADWMRVVDEISGSVEFGDWGQASSPFQPWVLFSNSTASNSCVPDDGYIHPDYPNRDCS